MANLVLKKFLEQDSFKLPRILPTGACMTENVTLKEALADRQRGDPAKTQDDVYEFVDSDDRDHGKGKVEKFIWDLWTSDDLDSDQLNYSILESKMVHSTIPTRLSVAAIDLLTYFLYNGRFQDEINFTALLDLNREVSSLNLDRQVKEAVASALNVASSFENLRKAWKKDSSDGKADSVLVHLTVTYIICNPEKVFTGDQPWLDMPRELLEKLTPDSLDGLMEELIEYGASVENRKTFTSEGKIYFKISHFELLFFLVAWAKRYYLRVVNPHMKITHFPSVSDIRTVLGSSIKMLHPTTFDVSKFNGDPAVKDARAFVNILNAYILLKDIIKDSEHHDEEQDFVDDQDLCLPLPGEDVRVPSSSKRARFDINAEDSIPVQRPTVLAIEGVQTTPTVEMISKLFGTVRLTDKTITAQYSDFQLDLHSYVFRLRKSVFADIYNLNQWTSAVIDLGGVTERSAVNFIKSFYLGKEELRKVVTVDLEFCFLALLFQVDFLLETVFFFTKGNRTCMESRVMHFVSAHRRYHGSTRDERQMRLKELGKNLQSDALGVVKTISFKFLFDEAMIQDLLGDYDAGGTGFYYKLIDELERASQIQMWLRKESNAAHDDRLKSWKTSGVIQLGKVSKDELKDLANRGFVDMADAIEYSYAIGASKK